MAGLSTMSLQILANANILPDTILKRKWSRTSPERNGWIAFFLQALIEQATENNQKATAIIDLDEEMKEHVPEVTHSEYAIRAIDTLFSRPIFKTSGFYHGIGNPQTECPPYPAKTD